MELIKEALTFDDVLLLPRHSTILPNQTNISLNLSKKLKLNVPFLSAAMDTVTEYEMALEMAKQGGLGIIHRNLSAQEQSLQVKKIKKKNLKVGAAIGTSSNDIYRAKLLSDNDVDMIIIDTAHGDSKKVFQTVYNIKKINKRNLICVGNIATGEAANSLYNVGADIVKVGIGPGSICTTRMIAGIGVPQITALSNVKKKLKKKNIKIISDGGIKFSGDIIKAIAAGADAIMMGSIFAGTKESPGKKFKIRNKYYKNYRGMGSIGAMSAGSSNRYFQENFKDRSKFIAEGVEGRVEYKGPLSKIIYQMQGGLRSSMGYIGAKNLKDIKKNAKFIKITKAGFYESMVHSVDAIESSLNFKL